MKKIIWTGDSTAAFNQADTFPQTGIGQVFSLYCKRDYITLDFAKNGASSKSFYDEGLFVQAENLISQGDYLFIQFGHNDEKPRKDRYTEPFSTYQEYLLCYVDSARKKGAYPVLVTPLCRRWFGEGGKVTDSHGEYPEAVRMLGKREGIPVVDLTMRSRELLERTGELLSRRWFMYFPAHVYARFPEGMEDNTHLHYEGAVMMAGLIAQELKKIGGVWADMLEPGLIIQGEGSGKE